MYTGKDGRARAGGGVESRKRTIKFTWNTDKKTLPSIQIGEKQSGPPAAGRSALLSGRYI